MPTLKQKRAIQKIAEKIGNPQELQKTNWGEIMREAGYSLITSKTPQRLTDSKGFRKLLMEYFPNERINEVLNEIVSDKKDKRSRLDAIKEICKL
ncbi:MAG: hypothetical protein AB1414_01150, partial [bacterium]